MSDPSPRIPRPPPVLLECEALVLLQLLCGAAIMLAGYLADAAAWPVAPIPIVPIAATAAGAAWACLVRGRGGWVVGFARARLAGFLAIVVAFAVVGIAPAWPSLLPISEGPDLVHHLSLIRFIQERHALPHDPALGAYLVEMVPYTPGSHILAAVLADSMGTEGIRVVHSLEAAALALKAGLVYCVLVRALPGGSSRMPLTVAGTLLLLIPHAFLLRSFTHFNFYAQVISETYAIAMLWTLVAWHDRRARRLLVLSGVFGVAVFLTWPVWIGPPVLALAVLAIARPSGSWRERLGDVAVALAPVAIVAAAYSARRIGAAAIITSGGDAVVPSAAAFGGPFLILVVAGTVMAARARGALVPVLAFAAACILQMAAFIALQVSRGGTGDAFYFAYKMFHLLLYPAAIAAAVGLAALWHGGARTLAPRWERAPLALAWALPAIVVIWAVRAGLPVRPVPSPLTEPLYQAGLWARGHLPPACIDYLTPHWLTGYWLHVDVLGNPRISDRMRQETFEYRETLGRWIEPGSLPYGIAGDVESLPPDVRRNIRILQRFGPAAVVERADGRSRCDDDTPSLRSRE